MVLGKEEQVEISSGEFYNRYFFSCGYTVDNHVDNLLVLDF